MDGEKGFQLFEIPMDERYLFVEISVEGKR